LRGEPCDLLLDEQKVPTETWNPKPVFRFREYFNKLLVQLLLRRLPCSPPVQTADSSPGLPMGSLPPTPATRRREVQSAPAAYSMELVVDMDTVRRRPSKRE
jgi:hypothetical protein